MGLYVGSTVINAYDIEQSAAFWTAARVMWSGMRIPRLRF
jgi:hypothetical protein